MVPAATATPTMKAVRNPRYGPPDDLRLQDVARPTVGPDQMLVRVRAASVNPFDWYLMRGRPYLVRLITGLRGPRGGGIPGVDVAGTDGGTGPRRSPVARSRPDGSPGQVR
jgi:NADPH:quinone reductase-like Zn-dependent oxidoreductase